MCQPLLLRWDHRNPYITTDEVQKLLDEWNKKTVAEDAQTLAYSNTFKDYFIEAGELLGPDVRMATTLLQLSNGKTRRVVATVMQDKFDRHKAWENLRFFSSVGRLRRKCCIYGLLLAKLQPFPTTLFSRKECQSAEHAATKHGTSCISHLVMRFSTNACLPLIADIKCYTRQQ